MKAQPSWQILECCLKKMMLVITASASPVFWCSAPPADLRVSWLLPLTPLLSCVVMWWEKLLPTPLPPHYIWVSSFIIAIKVLYAGFSQQQQKCLKNSKEIVNPWKMWKLSGFHLHKQYVNVTHGICFSVLFCFSKAYHNYHPKHIYSFYERGKRELATNWL